MAERAEFKLRADFEPAGDQPGAIDALEERLLAGEPVSVLLGVTGSGKTFTMSHVIARLGRPALVLAPNKTLAAQLYMEFRSFFPGNAVGFFVSYYDYYQPEAYIPSTDTYIAKDASINEAIDRLRNEATMALLTRRDVIIVASVSCIYGLGSPQAYADLSVRLEKGMEIDRDRILHGLTRIQYRRNNLDFRRGAFRVRGDVIEIFPAYAEDRVLRVEMFGDQVESIFEVDPLRGEVLAELQEVRVFPTTHYVTPEERMARALVTIEEELEERLAELRSQDKLLEAQRLEQRTRYDLELLRETGVCQGIENYSRHLDGRAPGEPPATLLDYFPPDFLVFVDESHVTIPQLGGMYEGDMSRKETLVRHGFRLPSAKDNRPLNFREFVERAPRMVCVSATPGPWELEQTGGKVVEQVIRPTGLVDPRVEVRPCKGQVDDLLHEVRLQARKGRRSLVTTLTKRMAEELSEYFLELGVKAKYLHSDIDTIERSNLIRDLRTGVFDCLVGVNLLREGLDLPEVGLVAVLDADKEGFLRSETSLIQVAGRAARNVEGKVIFYADKTTGSMERALAEMRRRREKQERYNLLHGITPRSVVKEVRQGLSQVLGGEEGRKGRKGKGARQAAEPAGGFRNRRELVETITRLREEMLQAARRLDYEEAARLRDRVLALEEVDLELSG